MEVAELEGDDKEWSECWNCCGEGFSHHDCGEDTCCCLDPENNVLCDVRRGAGGYWINSDEVSDE